MRKIKSQINCEVTAQLISAFVFATRTVQFLFFFIPKCRASSHLLLLHRPVCIGPGRKHRRLVSRVTARFNAGGDSKLRILHFDVKA